MLRRLSVENCALIDKLEMELDPHLNIITGETGAGKSILLGALGLLLGAKNDGQAMKDATQLHGGGDLRPRGKQSGRVFRRERPRLCPRNDWRMITPAGKSRAFVNDVPVQLAQLRELGARLLDIHSQHQNLILSSEEFRTSALDTVAANGELLTQYAAQYARLTELRRRLKRPCARSRQRPPRRRVAPVPDRGTHLGQPASRRAGRTGGGAGGARRRRPHRRGADLLRNALDADETGAGAAQDRRTNSAISAATTRRRYARRLRSVLEELKDINGSAAAACERLDADPERLAKCSARLDTLIALQQKHRAADEAELIALRDRCAAQLAISSTATRDRPGGNRPSRKQPKRPRRWSTVCTRRAKAAAGFEKHILSTLARLGMPERFPPPTLAPLAEPGRTGRDSVQFLFTANPRMTPQPVERIASGGELSRVMLALKALLAERMQLPTIIFDEIDTGVSGRIADAMGEIIASLSASMQVVDITHLPQVASKSTAHFVVYKRGGRTDITRLGDEERVTEIAKMLSGSEITDAAVAQARILLGK